MSQNFENHAKFVPAFHFFILPVFLFNVIWCITRLIRSFSVESVVSLVLALAFFLLAFYARIFALTVQDRLIRLEMRLRLQQLLPQDFCPRIPEFTVDQLVALRFASDAELPALCRKVLDDKIADRKTIKKMVQNWQADLLRA
ncbi:MAG TPA: DUF6526 family protein [Candidatus Limnocylindria bacterium]|nr:DUF6526 family protein [Candidatus Limnocylindria bacterium]